MSIKAVVQSVVPDGKHGAYAVATSENIDGSITFSLKPPIWNEEAPESGEVVLLDKVRKKQAGWKANEVRYLRPSDEQRYSTITLKQEALRKRKKIIIMIEKDVAVINHTQTEIQKDCGVHV